MKLLTIILHLFLVLTVSARQSAYGTIEQVTHYYQFGAPYSDSSVTNPSLQPYKYNSKEFDTTHKLFTYDYGARQYDPLLTVWHGVDPMCEKDYRIGTSVYCRNNPVKLIDSDGCEIRGVTRRDATIAVNDIREMFSDMVFENFRNLIVQSGKKQNGKSLAKINPIDIGNAFDGIKLSEDQKALVEMVVNTINSPDLQLIEYISEKSHLSEFGTKLLANEISKTNLPIKKIMEANSGIPISLISNLSGGGLTIPYDSKNTYSIIIDIPSMHSYGRAVTVGHEVLGHGRSLSIGRGKANQHIDAVQTENLILRVMGISHVNDGSNHGPRQFIENAEDLPDFR